MPYEYQQTKLLPYKWVEKKYLPKKVEQTGLVDYEWLSTNKSQQLSEEEAPHERRHAAHRDFEKPDPEGDHGEGHPGADQLEADGI